MKRQKTKTEKWLISQLAICRREINLYQTEAYRNHPNAGQSIDYMKRCQYDYTLELKRHREREGIIHA